MRRAGGGVPGRLIPFLVSWMDRQFREQAPDPTVHFLSAAERVYFAQQMTVTFEENLLGLARCRWTGHTWATARCGALSIHTRRGGGRIWPRDGRDVRHGGCAVRGGDCAHRRAARIFGWPFRIRQTLPTRA